ncbi:hypothetical protein QQ054_06995 [Oscillatoria amoena NRMC-F 0135]|nr:hypothetical protein [Oscillatoria laete-virens]MDL5045780.1 hypothetical protein [Oscillatoria amoena NRMC-F 0135]MDL5055152.1 hypothetical protein [Oscillatoria laete-virens NRMC-F 0139]
MSIEQLEAAVTALTPEERKQFAEWFDQYRWEHDSCEEQDIHPDQMSVLLTRRKEIESNPAMITSLDGFFEKMRSKLQNEDRIP